MNRSPSGQTHLSTIIHEQDPTRAFARPVNRPDRWRICLTCDVSKSFQLS
jgi:hypothetical protein